MKFKIFVKNQGSSFVWDEEYDTEQEIRYGRGGVKAGKEPEHMLLLWEVKDKQSAEAYGRAVIDFFNSGLRPGEQPREFVSAEIPEN